MTNRIAVFSAASGVAAGILSSVIGGWDLAHGQK